MAIRRLEVEIIGDPTSVQRAFRSVGTQASLLERKFGGIGRSANTALGLAGRRVSALGQAARTAAPFIAGGLALGIGKAVAEAREANKVGAQTEAVIKSMGGAAGVTAEQVAELSEALSVKAGIDDEVIQRGANLLLTFKNIRNEAGKGNDIFNQTTAVALDMSVALGQDLKQSAIQVGKALNDPAVGLTALRRIGVSFNEQQSEQIKKLFESGEQLKAQKLILRELTSEFEGSAEAQADSFDKLRVVFDNFAEDIGFKIVPVLADLGDKVADIVTDKKLSDMEKFERISDLFEEIGIKAIKALEDIAPQVAEVGAKMSGRFALAFGRAFLEADILGKLFLGGLFIKAIGGPGAFRAIGVLIGKNLGRGIAIGLVLALPLLVKEAHDFGARHRDDFKQLGADIGEFLVNAMIDVVNFGIEKINKIPLVPDIPKLGKIDIQGPLESIRELQRKLDKNMGVMSEVAARGILATGDELDRGGKRARDRLFPHWEGILKDADRKLESVERTSERHGEGVRDKLDRRTEQTASRVGGNFARMANAARGGLQALLDNTNEALKGFGAKQLNFTLKTAFPGFVGTEIGRRIQGRQRGGGIPGFQTGDIVPAMLEPGEFVINRNAVAAIGQDVLAEINAGIPRFQSGGSVPRVTLRGPAGPLRDLGQSSLDRTRSAATRFLSRRLGAIGDLGGGFGRITGGGGVAANLELGRAMMLAFGFGASQWPALRALWAGESGWSETARNASSGAYGIPQALPPGKMGSTALGAGAAAAKAQIGWGLRYIAERYGSPAGAFSFWLSQSPHWYRHGGPVGPRSGPLAGPLRQAIRERRDINEILRQLERRERRLEKRLSEADSRRERRRIRGRQQDVRERTRERERQREATQELISSLRELRIELKEQRVRAQAELNISRSELERALTDKLMHILGAATNPTLRTAGAGSVSRA